MSKIISDHQRIAGATQTSEYCGDIQSLARTYIGFIQEHRNKQNHPLGRQFYVADEEEGKVYLSLIKGPMDKSWGEIPRKLRHKLMRLVIGNVQSSHALLLIEVFEVVYLSCHGLNDHFMWSFKVGSTSESDLIYQDLPTTTLNIWKEGINSVVYTQI